MAQRSGLGDFHLTSNRCRVPPEDVVVVHSDVVDACLPAQLERCLCGRPQRDDRLGRRLGVCRRRRWWWRRWRWRWRWRWRRRGAGSRRNRDPRRRRSVACSIVCGDPRLISPTTCERFDRESRCGRPHRGSTSKRDLVASNSDVVARAEIRERHARWRCLRERQALWPRWRRLVLPEFGAPGHARGARYDGEEQYGRKNSEDPRAAIFRLVPATLGVRWRHGAPSGCRSTLRRTF